MPDTSLAGLRRPPLPRAAGPRPPWRAAAGLGAATASGLAALVHASVVGPHLKESRLFGGALAAMAAAQGAWAVLAVVRPSARTARAGGVVNAAILLIWALSRTAGLPVGPRPWTPEAPGELDVAAAGSEGVVAAASLVLAGTAGRGGVAGGPALLRIGCVLAGSGLAAALLPHPPLHAPGACCEPHLLGHLAVLAGMAAFLAGLAGLALRAGGPLARPHRGARVARGLTLRTGGPPAAALARTSERTLRERRS